MEEPEAYTLGVWRVKPGMEDAFVQAWKELGAYFLSLPKPPGTGKLVQSVQDSTLFYSFGPWNSFEDIQAMRSDSRTPEMLAKLSALCVDATPGAFRLVAQVRENA